MLVGLALVLAVRPDPREIGAAIARAERDEGDTGPDDAADPEAAPLRELLGRQGVIPALIAAQASFAVMVGVMTLTGAVVVDHFHHAAHHVFPIIAAHVVGMYALVIVVGDLIDRIGRTTSLAGGLLLMAASVISLLWIESVPATAAALFGLGLGWNLSFVAATAELADRTEPWERGKLLGFNDLLSGLTGAALALAGGVALTALGVAALAIGGAVLVIVPARVDPAARARRRVTRAGADRWVSMTRSSIAALATIAAAVVGSPAAAAAAQSIPPAQRPHSRVVTYDRGVVHVTRLTMSVTRSAGRLHARVDLAATNESSRLLRPGAPDRTLHRRRARGARVPGRGDDPRHARPGRLAGVRPARHAAPAARAPRRGPGRAGRPERARALRLPLRRPPAAEGRRVARDRRRARLRRAVRGGDRRAPR